MPVSFPPTIGRYEIRREIGRGAMGIVYEAYDPGLDRRVALKTISLTFAVSDDERQRFEERFFVEARVAARFTHPGIVVVHDVGRDDSMGTLFIVLEYLEGQTLGEVAPEGVPLSWREALRLAYEVAQALDYAHSQRVVHRDVKPANIMVLPSGQAKIMDFGIAKIETARLKLTMDGQFFGTPLYMAPEQVYGEKLDHRIDIFALGAILYQLLTGQLAFAGPNLPKIVSRVAQEDPVPPSYVIPTLPPDSDYVVARALAKSPADRYPTAAAFAQDLEDVLAGRPPRHREGWMPAPPRTDVRDVPAAPGPQVFEGDAIEVDLALESLNPAGDVRAPADVEDELARLVAAPPTTPPPSTPAEEPPRPAPATALPPPRAGRVADRRERPAPAHGPAAPPAGRLQQTRMIPLWIVGAGGLVLLLTIGAIAYTVWLRRPAPSRETEASLPTVVIPRVDPPPTTVPHSAPTLPAETRPPQPVPVASAPAAGGPARLEIDFEHSLKTGELRVWIDDELVLEEELDSRVTKKILAYRKRQGSVEGALQVGPGEHTIAIEVHWDDNIKRRRISARFEGGTTRRLRASLGGLLKKELSLEWE